MKIVIGNVGAEYRFALGTDCCVMWQDVLPHLSCLGEDCELFCRAVEGIYLQSIQASKCEGIEDWRGCVLH